LKQEIDEVKLISKEEVIEVRGEVNTMKVEKDKWKGKVVELKKEIEEAEEKMEKMLGELRQAKKTVEEVKGSIEGTVKVEVKKAVGCNTTKKSRRTLTKKNKTPS